MENHKESIPFVLCLIGLFTWSFVGLLMFVERDMIDNPWRIKNKYKQFLFNCFFGPVIWVWMIFYGIMLLYFSVEEKVSKSKMGEKLSKIGKAIRDWFEKE